MTESQYEVVDDFLSRHLEDVALHMEETRLKEVYYRRKSDAKMFVFDSIAGVIQEPKEIDKGWEEARTIVRALRSLAMKSQVVVINAQQRPAGLHALHTA